MSTASKHKKSHTSFWDKHPLILPAAVFLALFFTGLVSVVLLGSSTQGPSDTRIVNIYVDGGQRTVTTRAKTVGELIDRLEDVTLAEEDVVEPAEDEPILEDDTQVNIYRARPVKVLDGDRVLTRLTAQRSPRLVIADMGLDIEPEDEVRFERIDTNVLENSASEQVVIKRSIEVQLSIYGAVKTVRTTASTTDDLVQEQGITQEDGDTLEPRAGTALLDGMLIAVNRPGIKTISEVEAIAYQTETVDDSSIIAGSTKVQTSGVDGVKTVIYEVEEDDDGAEVSRRAIQSVVTKKPVVQVVARGTKIAVPTFNPSVTVSGDKAALMSAAGIAESDYPFVDYIMSKESGWRPGAVNASSGAFGLCQSLPASKMASAGADYRTNPVTQLRWCASYAEGRYGGWENSYNAWLVQNWW